MEERNTGEYRYQYGVRRREPDGSTTRRQSSVRVNIWWLSDKIEASILCYQTAVPTTTTTMTKSSKPPRSPRGSAPVSSARRMCVSLTNSLVDAVTTRSELQERRSPEHVVENRKQFQEELHLVAALLRRFLIFLLRWFVSRNPLFEFLVIRFRALSKIGIATPGYIESQWTNRAWPQRR